MFVGYESGGSLDQIMDDPSRRYHLRARLARSDEVSRAERQTRRGLEILPARLTNPRSSILAYLNSSIYLSDHISISMEIRSYMKTPPLPDNDEQRICLYHRYLTAVSCASSAEKQYSRNQRP